MFDKNMNLFTLNKQRLSQFKKYILESEEEDDHHMIPSINLLEQMNNLWFFTLDSQGGHTNKFEQDGVKYTTEERSYVIGFIPNVIYESFKKNIESCPNLLLRKMDINLVQEEIELTRVEQINEDGTVENSIPTSIPGKISQDEIDNFLDMFHYIEPSAYGGGVKDLVLDPKEWTGLIIVDSRWNYSSTSENSAFKCIINSLTKVIRNPKKGGKSRRRRR